MCVYTNFLPQDKNWKQSLNENKKWWTGSTLPKLLNVNFVYENMVLLK